MRKCVLLLTVAYLMAMLPALVVAHRRPMLNGYERDAAHMDSTRNKVSDHIEEQFKFCTICKTALAPTLREAIESSGSDRDAKEVMDAAVEKLSRTHYYSLQDRTAVRRDAESDEIDAEVHEYIQNMLFNTITSRGLYALFSLWHEFPAHRRTHFDLLVEHVVCACHHDRLMRLPNDRLHKYLQDFEAALSGALLRYGGHPSEDPALRWDGTREVHPFAHQDAVPHEHEEHSKYKHRLGPQDKVLPHQHVPGQPGLGMGMDGDL